MNLTFNCISMLAKNAAERRAAEIQIRVALVTLFNALGTAEILRAA
jgi:hypothetical protein